MTTPVNHGILDDIDMFLAESVGNIQMDGEPLEWFRRSECIEFRDEVGWYEIVVRPIEEPSE